MAVDAALGSNAIGPQRRWSIWPDTQALLEVKRPHALIITARLPWSAWISENCAARALWWQPESRRREGLAPRQESLAF